MGVAHSGDGTPASKPSRKSSMSSIVKIPPDGVDIGNRTAVRSQYRDWREGKPLQHHPSASTDLLPPTSSVVNKSGVNSAPVVLYPKVVVTSVDRVPSQPTLVAQEKSVGNDESTASTSSSKPIKQEEDFGEYASSSYLCR